MKIFNYLFSRKYREKIKFEHELLKNNPGTKIIPQNAVPVEILKFGKHSYGNPKIRSFGVEGEKLIIGNFVSIAEDVTFILSGGHYTDTFTTYPFKNEFFLEKKKETLCKGQILIEDDVWIGTGVMILSGVTVKQGAVIGAGAVVVNDLEGYGIYGGVPAKLIKYRFPKEIREELKKIDFSSIDFTAIKTKKELLYEKLDIEILKELKKALKIE